MAGSGRMPPSCGARRPESSVASKGFRIARVQGAGHPDAEAQVWRSARRATAGDDYVATLRWTEDGVPHILASELGSAGFGQGYVFASLSGCVLADQIVKVRSERARFFGPGEHNGNLDSDFLHLHLGVYRQAQRQLSAQPEDVRELVRGYPCTEDRSARAS